MKTPHSGYFIVLCLVFISCGNKKSESISQDIRYQSLANDYLDINMSLKTDHKCLFVFNDFHDSAVLFDGNWHLKDSVFNVVMDKPTTPPLIELLGDQEPVVVIDSIQFSLEQGASMLWIWGIACELMLSDSSSRGNPEI